MRPRARACAGRGTQSVERLAQLAPRRTPARSAATSGGDHADARLDREERRAARRDTDADEVDGDRDMRAIRLRGGDDDANVRRTHEDDDRTGRGKLRDALDAAPATSRTIGAVARAGATHAPPVSIRRRASESGRSAADRDPQPRAR